MNSKAQNILYVVIILIVTAIIVFLSPTVSQKPHGILLPTGTTYPAISPKTVRLYPSKPKSSQDIGIIRTAMHLTPADYKKDPKVITASSLQYAKELAAKSGANGIVITQIGETRDQGPLNQLVVYGTAILTP